MAQSRVTRIVGGRGSAVRRFRTLRVEVISGADRGRRLVLEQPILRVGSHAANDLVLADRTVSQHHLEIAVADEGYRVTDLGSSNGTLVGRARLGEVTVAQPVELELGATRLRLTPLEDEVEIPASTQTRFGKLEGESPLMRELFLRLESIAASDGSVLVEGETGTGKELLAESLHEQSPRAGGPFVVVDCGALAGGLIESELFGHQRGAFSGAAADRAGLLEQADGGTVFFDEIGELPPPLQVKLLGALERRQVRRLGESEPRPFDARVVAATNRDLLREVNAGRFRADLFYRLAVVRVRLPPLRERLEDLPRLAESFLAELRRRDPSLPESLSAITLARLAAQPWPGNVRELRNAVERVALLASESRAGAAVEPYFTARAQVLEEFERGFFAALVREHGVNIRRIAKLTQLDRRYLQRILRRLGLLDGGASE